VAGKQKLDDLLARILVQVSGRFVCDDDRGIRRKRACDSYALLFAARQLRGIVVEPVA